MIERTSSWVLRIGVILSMVVMFTGLTRAFLAGGVTVKEMEHRPFVMNASSLGHGLAHLEPFTLMEFGVLLLVLTPIMRVLTTMVLFATEERDGLYTGVTFLVLMMTLTSLLLLH